jgi:hypothetical protein
MRIESSPSKRRRSVIPRKNRVQQVLGVVLFLELCRILDWAFHRFDRSPDGKKEQSDSFAKPVKEDTTGSHAETMQLNTTDIFSDREEKQRSDGKVSLSSLILPAQNPTLHSIYKQNENGEIFGDSRHSCEANYDESFSELINGIENATVFCNSQVSVYKDPKVQYVSIV